MSVRTQIRNNLSFKRKVFSSVVDFFFFKVCSTSVGGIIKVNTGTFVPDFFFYLFFLNEGHIKILGNVLQWLNLFLLENTVL